MLRASGTSPLSAVTHTRAGAMRRLTGGAVPTLPARIPRLLPSTPLAAAVGASQRVFATGSTHHKSNARQSANQQSQAKPARSKPEEPVRKWPNAIDSSVSRLLMIEKEMRADVRAVQTGQKPASALVEVLRKWSLYQRRPYPLVGGIFSSAVAAYTLLDCHHLALDLYKSFPTVQWRPGGLLSVLRSARIRGDPTAFLDALSRLEGAGIDIESNLEALLETCVKSGDLGRATAVLQQLASVGRGLSPLTYRFLVEAAVAQRHTSRAAAGLREVVRMRRLLSAEAEAAAQASGGSSSGAGGAAATSGAAAPAAAAPLRANEPSSAPAMARARRFEAHLARRVLSLCLEEGDTDSALLSFHCLRVLEFSIEPSVLQDTLAAAAQIGAPALAEAVLVHVLEAEAAAASAGSAAAEAGAASTAATATGGKASSLRLTPTLLAGVVRACATGGDLVGAMRMYAILHNMLQQQVGASAISSSGVVSLEGGAATGAEAEESSEAQPADHTSSAATARVVDSEDALIGLHDTVVHGLRSLVNRMLAWENKIKTQETLAAAAAAQQEHEQAVAAAAAADLAADVPAEEELDVAAVEEAAAAEPLPEVEVEGEGEAEQPPVAVPSELLQAASLQSQSDTTFAVAASLMGLHPPHLDEAGAAAAAAAAASAGGGHGAASEALRGQRPEALSALAAGYSPGSYILRVTCLAASEAHTLGGEWRAVYATAVSDAAAQLLGTVRGGEGQPLVIGPSPSAWVGRLDAASMTVTALLAQQHGGAAQPLEEGNWKMFETAKQSLGVPMSGTLTRELLATRPSLCPPVMSAILATMATSPLRRMTPHWADFASRVLGMTWDADGTAALIAAHGVGRDKNWAAAQDAVRRMAESGIKANGNVYGELALLFLRMGKTEKAAATLHQAAAAGAAPSPSVFEAALRALLAQATPQQYQQQQQPATAASSDEDSPSTATTTTATTTSPTASASEEAAAAVEVVLSALRVSGYAPSRHVRALLRQAERSSSSSSSSSGSGAGTGGVSSGSGGATDDSRSSMNRSRERERSSRGSSYSSSGSAAAARKRGSEAREAREGAEDTAATALPASPVLESDTGAWQAASQSQRM